MAAVRCDLCDLPLSQCVHGAARQKVSTAKNKTAAQSAKKPSKAAARSSPSKCSRCGKRARYGRYAVCTKCLAREGGQTCRTCGRLFRPEPEYKSKKPKCKTCRRGNWRGKEVYVVAQAGSPGLGKRA